MKFIAFVIGAFLAHQTLACDCQAPERVQVSVHSPVIKAPCIDLPTVRAPVVKRPIVERPVIQQIHFHTDVEAPCVQTPVVNQPPIPKPIVSPPIIVTPRDSSDCQRGHHGHGCFGHGHGSHESHSTIYHSTTVGAGGCEGCAGNSGPIRRSQLRTDQAC